jgi:Pentapeptide repeats (8 copies)
VTSAAERKRNIQRALWLSLAILAAPVVIYMLIWYGPDVIARHDVGNVTGQVVRVQQARDAARGRLLTLGAGVFAAGALLYTGRNYRVAQQTLKVTEQGQRRTLELTEQGQVTDRYTRAIEQLGSEKLDVRIGGIYALERIARDSARDHPTVMEVVSAFVREHSHEQWPPSDPGGPAQFRSTRPDIQAAVTVIGRRDAKRDIRRINLTRTDLTSADLTGVDLTGANLTRTDLTFADFTSADLTDADLTSANLTSANLTGADLTGADLTSARLPGAKGGGFAVYAVRLPVAILTGAILTGADLTGAQWPRNAPVPEGWVQDADSGRLRRASEGAGDAGN